MENLADSDKDITDVRQREPPCTEHQPEQEDDYQQRDQLEADDTSSACHHIFPLTGCRTWRIPGNPDTLPDVAPAKRPVPVATQHDLADSRE